MKMTLESYSYQTCEHMPVCKFDFCEPEFCGYYKAKKLTEADKIRMMDDDALAEYLAKMLAGYTEGLYDGEYSPSNETIQVMKSMLLEQLQQPVEG